MGESIVNSEGSIEEVGKGKCVCPSVVDGLKGSPQDFYFDTSIKYLIVVS